MSAWRRNAWLGVFGAALVFVAVLGTDALVAFASRAYKGLPMLAPVFRADHERQVRALPPVVTGLGGAALLAYALASRWSLAIWPRLLALRGDARERLRTSAAAAVVLYSILLVALRATRDVFERLLLQVAPLALLGLTPRPARPIISV